MDECAICDSQINELQEAKIEVTNARRKTLEKVSQKRGDKLLIKLRGQTSFLHELCYNNYTNYRQVERYEAAKNSLLNKLQSNSSSSGNNFDFNSSCLFCLNDASDTFILKESKKTKNKRYIVVKIISEKNLNTLIDHENKRNANDTALKNLLKSIDLKVDRPRFYRQCQQKYLKNYEAHPRPVESDIIVKFVIDYLKKNSDECQFSLNEILRLYEGEQIDITYLSKKFQKNYANVNNDDVIITHVRGKDTLISFKNCVSNLTQQFGSSNIVTDEAEKRRKIVQAAADIIREDIIRSQVYNTDRYPVPHDFLSESNKDIPETLKLLLDVILLKNNKSDIDACNINEDYMLHESDPKRRRLD